jgi:hypothetical protein
LSAIAEANANAATATFEDCIKPHLTRERHGQVRSGVLGRHSRDLRTALEIEMTTSTAHVSRFSAACILAAAGVGHGPRDVTTYQGKAVISDSGSGCKLVWGAPNSSEGTGEYADGVLTIRFILDANGRKGVVKYTRAPNGDLHGVWWYNTTPDTWGTESLLR